MAVKDAGQEVDPVEALALVVFELEMIANVAVGEKGYVGVVESEPVVYTTFDQAAWIAAGDVTALKVKSLLMLQLLTQHTPQIR